MPQAELIHRMICPKLNMTVADSNPRLLPTAMAHFNSFPWTCQLLEQSNAIPFITQGIAPYDNHRDQFLSKTLHKPDALKHMLCVFFPNDGNHVWDPKRGIDSLTTLYSLGPSVSGPKDSAHGGMIMTMLDEAMGSLFEVNTALGKTGSNYETMSVTGSINVNFLKPVPLNEPIIATAWVDAVEGRKTIIKTVLKDKNSHELAKCSSTWVALKPSKI